MVSVQAALDLEQDALQDHMLDRNEVAPPRQKRDMGREYRRAWRDLAASVTCAYFTVWSVFRVPSCHDRPRPGPWAASAGHGLAGPRHRGELHR